MLTFDNDDNDDNLSLGSSKRSSGVPQRPANIPATPSPFGKSQGTGVNAPAENKPASLPPAKSPFTSPPKRPNLATPDVAKKVLPPRLPAALPPREVPAISEPEPATTSDEENYFTSLMSGKGSSAAIPNLPNLPVVPNHAPVQLPQKNSQQPQQQFNPAYQQQQQNYNPAFDQPQQQQNPQQQYNDQQQQNYNPAFDQQQQNYNPNQFSSPDNSQLVTGKNKKQKKAKTPKPVKVVREKTYDGERKKILGLRIVAGVVASVIVLAGLNALFLPNNGPTQAQVRAAAQDSVNYTGFPTLSGEQFALDFSRAYFNFTSKSEERKAQLLNFASDDLVKQIDIQILSSAEYDLVKTAESPSYNAYTISQSINYGPYVVSTNNLDATNAVFTIKVGLDSGAVVYLEVPVKYDEKDYSLTLAGPPSFVKPLQNQGETAVADYTVNFGSGDEAIQDDFAPDLEAYLTAWAISDTTIIDRYTLDSATDNAKLGLQGSMVFRELQDFTVEPADEANPKTATQRRVEVLVIWEDPKTGLRYPQQYRMLLGLNQENTWSVYDIENFAILN